MSRTDPCTCSQAHPVYRPAEQRAPAPAKLEPGHSARLDDALERDPRVLRYRWNPSEGRMQVTGYDPARVRFDPTGRPLLGPLVQLEGKTLRLDDALALIRGRAEARLRAVKLLEATPLGSKTLLSSRECAPVYQALFDSLRHCVRAGSLLRAGKGAEATRALSDATASYNQASIKLNTARRQIENNVELAVGVLKAVKAAGEVAELVLIATGAGAAAKGAGHALALAGKADWVVTAAKIATGAALKTSLGAVGKLRDQLLELDKPVDWKQLGKSVAWSALWSVISGSVSEQLEGALKASGAGEWSKGAERVLTKIALAVQRSAIELGIRYARQGRTATPNQLIAHAARAQQQQIRKLLEGAGLDVGKSAGKAVLDALLKAER